MKRFITLPLLAIIASFGVSCTSVRHNAVLSNAEASFRKPPSLTGTEWLLTDLPGTTVIATSKASFSVLDNGRAAGNASCNRFTAAIEINGNNLKFGSVASTRMVCGDESLTAQESKFLEFLSAANRFEMSDPYLLVFANGHDQPLHFIRIPPDTFD